jgi:DNA primase
MAPSVPIAWSELSKEGFRPDAITIRTVFDRLEKTADPWKYFWRRASSLKVARQKLEDFDVAA